MTVQERKVRPLDLIGPTEVLTSSELLSRLVDKGYNPAAARQMISRDVRGGHQLWRSARLQLERGERLFARRTFSGTPNFYQQAADRLHQLRPGLARCLSGLATNGVLNRVHAQ